MENENSTDKKNVILLTIIAIATLLVAMVGATFAYFTAQRGKGAQADITVKTSTSDTLEMGTFSPLTIVATQQNFGENKGTRSGEAKGEIKLTANDAEATTEVSYCYTADLVVKQNEFMYSMPEGAESKSTVYEQNSNHDPELVFALFKTPNATSDGNGTEQEYNITIGDGADTLTYLSNIIETNVCTGDDDVVTSEDLDSDEKCPKKQISGYDITTVAPTKNEPEADAGEATYTDKIIKIPVLNGEDKAIEENAFVHQIKASKGATTIDKWRAVVYFVNYDYDQEKNTGKVFNAQLKFTTVDCTTGAVPEP